MIAANTANVTLALGHWPGADWRVCAVCGTESISALYHITVDAVSSDNVDLAPQACLGTPARLSFHGPRGRRTVHGIIRRFERARHGSHDARVRITIAPIHWLLTRRFQSRVFVEARCPDMTVPGIIAQVVASAGIAPDRIRFALSETYQPREFVAQYRETDMQFISRLMEDEGLYYFFEHTVDGHCMVVGDDPAAFRAAGEAYLYREPSGLTDDEETVVEVCDDHEITFGAAALDDFSFRKPGTDLLAVRRGERFTSLERSEYPGDYEDRAAGERFTQIRLEEAQCARQRLTLRSNILSLAAGRRFHLAEHRCAEVNGEYLATGVHYDLRLPQAAEEETLADAPAHVAVAIQAIPAATRYRPARVTPRPRIAGAQTALVVGPESEDIHTDAYGRIKVQFHWDREGSFGEDSSAWIRVSQGWAGGGYGAMFLPRVGQEVIVEFLEGNPDRPIVTGRVYNNDHMPPYKLPDQRTRSTIKSASTPGTEESNEIRFEDKQHDEQLLLHAARDLHVRAKNDLISTIEHQRHTIVDEDDRELIKQSQHREVRLDLREKIGGTKSLTVAGDVGVQIDGNHGERIGGTCFLHAGKSVVIESDQAVTLKAGGNFIKIDASGITILGSMVKINSGGAADVGAPMSPTVPDAPAEADTVGPGRNACYTAKAVEDRTTTAPKSPPASWIEIELVDEMGQPIPGELFELTLPDGSVQHGVLGPDGLAHVFVPDPGACQISFPNLDAAAWFRNCAAGPLVAPPVAAPGPGLPSFEAPAAEPPDWDAIDDRDVGWEGDADVDETDLDGDDDAE